MITLLGVLPIDMTPAASVAVLMVFITGAVYWFASRNQPDVIPAAFRANFHWIVWSSSLFFGLAHLTNYEGASFGLDLLYVLPQTLGGLLLAYTRTRIGLWAAIAQHALFNGAYLIEVNCL